MFTHITLGIFCLTPYYSFKYYSLVQIIDEHIPTHLSIFNLHPDYTREFSVLPHNICANIFYFPRLSARIFCLSSVYSMFTQITPWNILSYPILFRQILILAQIIDENIPNQLSIFNLHPNYAIEYSVLPHIIPANIIPLPRLSTRIFRLSSVYSIFTQIILGNILSYPILFPKIFFLSPDYLRQYSVLAQYILCSPTLH